MAPTYSDISKMALKVLIPFPTTYECESAFSVRQAKSSKPVINAIHDKREGCVVQNGTKHSSTDSKEGRDATVTLIQ